MPRSNSLPLALVLSLLLLFSCSRAGSQENKTPGRNLAESFPLSLTSPVGAPPMLAPVGLPTPGSQLSPGGIGPSQGFAQANASILGAWISACQPPPANSPYPYRIRVTFTRSMVSETIGYFSQPGCPRGQLATLPRVYRGLYMIDPQAPAPSGGYAIDFSGPVGGLQPFDIVTVTNGQLMLGDTTGANNGSVPNLRPSRFYSAVPFSRE